VGTIILNNLEEKIGLVSHHVHSKLSCALQYGDNKLTINFVFYSSIIFNNIFFKCLAQYDLLET